MSWLVIFLVFLTVFSALLAIGAFLSLFTVSLKHEVTLNDKTHCVEFSNADDE